jgi:hypothetical protein
MYRAVLCRNPSFAQSKDDGLTFGLSSGILFPMAFSHVIFVLCPRRPAPLHAGGCASSLRDKAKRKREEGGK